MTPPTFSHNSHSSHNSHNSHNSQPCVAHLCLRAAVVIKQLSAAALHSTAPSPLHPSKPSGYLMTPDQFPVFPVFPDWRQPSLPAYRSCHPNTKTPACTLAHTRRTRARALGAKNAKKSQIFAFFCSKSFDKSILDDILCLVLRLLS